MQGAMTMDQLNGTLGKILSELGENRAHLEHISNHLEKLNGRTGKNEDRLKEHDEIIARGRGLWWGIGILAGASSWLVKHFLPLLIIGSLYGQTETRISPRAPDTGYQIIMGYSGTNVTYICKARSLQPTSANISVASATNANPVVFTISGGHGFNAATSPSAKPIITVSGGTGNWTAVNGTFTATIASSTTLSIPVDSTSLGALAGTVVFTTRAPLTTRPIWSVMMLTYDGSNNNTGVAWVGGVSSETNTCTTTPTQYQ